MFNIAHYNFGKYFHEEGLLVNSCDRVFQLQYSGNVGTGGDDQIYAEKYGLSRARPLAVAIS